MCSAELRFKVPVNGTFFLPNALIKKNQMNCMGYTYYYFFSLMDHRRLWVV